MQRRGPELRLKWKGFAKNWLSFVPELYLIKTPTFLFICEIIFYFLKGLFEEFLGDELK